MKLLVGLGFFSLAASAAIYPPLTRSMPLPKLAVRTERGEATTLGAVVRAAPGPIFVVPGFVTCHGACPLLARAVRSALVGRPPHAVVFLSFAADGAEALRDFRRREALPDSWKIVSARTVAEAKTFLDRFGYFFESRRGEYVHPSQVLVLSRDGEWRASAYVRDGLDRRTVSDAFAMADDRLRWFERLPTELADPLTLLAAGVLGLLASSGVVALTFLRRWRRAPGLSLPGRDEPIIS